MSLELALQENTAAIKELIARITAARIPELPGDSVKAESKKPAPTNAAKTEKPAATETVAASPSKSVDFTALKSDFLKAVAKNREGAIALLKEYGATKLTDIAAEKHVEVAGKVAALLGA